MKIYLDSADPREIEKRIATGMIDGITTNPSLVAQISTDFRSAVKDICQMVEGPISVQVTGETVDELLRKAETWIDISPSIMIKVHLSVEGLKACRFLVDQGIWVNVTLCFSVAQALLAAKSGATCVSPFVGRLEDVGYDGIETVTKMHRLYQHSAFKTQILAASIRSLDHVEKVSQIGIDIMTLPPKVFDQLYAHPLTDQGYQKFLDDSALIRKNDQ
jgi:transaldolase